jgi:hypothetical protein
VTRAITVLLEIMGDQHAPLRGRIKAAGALLAFEAPPEVVEEAKVFLSAISEDADQHVDDRLDALKLMRKAEAITAPTEDARRNRELWRQLEIGRRRGAMMDAGLWGDHPRDWADDLLSENYVAPPEALLGTPHSKARKRR